MSRVLPSFSRQSDTEDYEYDQKEELSPLIKQFAKSQIQAQPTAVDAARARNANSIVQQVNSIMTGKSRYATVDDAVKDFTERTGLSTYLETVKSAEEAKKKVNKSASEGSQVPESLAQYDFADQVVSYIQNNIKNSNAYSVAIPALQADILEIFGRRGLQSQDVMNDEFERYLSDCIYDAQKMLPPEHQNNNIGRDVGKDIEDSNDAWLGLQPAK